MAPGVKRAVPKNSDPSISRLNSDVTNGTSHTLLFIFLNVYIINLPTIIGIELLHGVGENI